MSLAKFIETYGNASITEGLIHWFRTYDRMQMMQEILDLRTDKAVDAKAIEKHIAQQIELIIKREIRDI